MVWHYHGRRHVDHNLGNIASDNRLLNLSRARIIGDNTVRRGARRQQRSQHSTALHGSKESRTANG